MAMRGIVWTGLVLGAIKVAVVAFIVLNRKELRDAGNFDFGGTAVDAGLIAGGTLLLNVILGFAKGGRRVADSAPLARGSSPARPRPLIAGQVTGHPRRLDLLRVGSPPRQRPRQARKEVGGELGSANARGARQRRAG